MAKRARLTVNDVLEHWEDSADLPTITHWAWKYTHSNLLKHPRTLEFNPRIHLIGYISVAVDSLVPERVPSSSRTPGHEATLLTVLSLVYSRLAQLLRCWTVL